MIQKQTTLEIHTRNGLGCYDITRRVADWVTQQQLNSGLLTLFICHTSASLMIQENADPDVLRDLETFFSRIVPSNPSLYRHTMEGEDDMPAHIRCALTQSQLNIPIVDGRLALGTWQGIYIYEHRFRPHRRKLVLHAIGE